MEEERPWERVWFLASCVFIHVVIIYAYLLEQKKVFTKRKELYTYRMCLKYHGRPSIVLEHDCDPHDVMKTLFNITRDNFACRQLLVLLFVFRNVYHVSFFHNFALLFILYFSYLCLSLLLLLLLLLLLSLFK